MIVDEVEFRGSAGKTAMEGKLLLPFLLLGHSPGAYVLVEDMLILVEEAGGLWLCLTL